MNGTAQDPLTKGTKAAQFSKGISSNVIHSASNRVITGEDLKDEVRDQ
jgi:hypothetical protein